MQVSTDQDFPNRLNNFIEKFGGKKIKSGNKYKVPLTFENVPTDIIVIFGKRDYEIIMGESAEPCLHIKIGSDFIGEIKYIRTTSPTRQLKCKLSPKNPGSWLVRLSEAVLCKLGIKKSRLQDEATLRCNNNSTSNYRFLLYRILNGKRSWYQDSFSYIPTFSSLYIKNNYGYYDSYLYNVDIDTLLAMPMQVFAKIVENHTEMSSILRTAYEDDIEKIGLMLDIQQIFETFPIKDQVFQDYMLDLYQQDCESFSLMSKFLDNTSSKEFVQVLRFPWSDIYNRIVLANYRMEKVHQCEKTKLDH